MNDREYHEIIGDRSQAFYIDGDDIASPTDIILFSHLGSLVIYKFKRNIFILLFYRWRIAFDISYHPAQFNSLASLENRSAS